MVDYAIRNKLKAMKVLLQDKMETSKESLQLLQLVLDMEDELDYIRQVKSTRSYYEE